MTNALCSLILPVFNEGPHLEETFAQVVAVLNGVDCDFEIIVVDDGSTDGTAQALGNIQASYPHVIVLIFSRNFGKEAAIEAGLRKAKGQACIVMDADLQHPPALLPSMLERWRGGALIVEAVKADRVGDSVFKRISGGLFNHIFSASTGIDLKNQSDFKLLDRSVVDFYLNIPEHRKFFRGVVAWSGIPTAKLSFTVPPPHGGRRSKWSFWSLVKYSFLNMALFSYAPLVLFGSMGFIIAVGSFAVGAFSFVKWFQGHSLPGFTSVILLVSFLGGLNLVYMSLLSYYIALTLDEVRRRPKYYIVSEK
jgi:dolichol-phosphate mannosyltransferase